MMEKRVSKGRKEGRKEGRMDARKVMQENVVKRIHPVCNAAWRQLAQPRAALHAPASDGGGRQ